MTVSSAFEWHLYPACCGAILGMPEWEETKSLTGSQGVALFSGLWDLSPSWGVFRQNIRRKMKRWMEKQHLALCRGPCSTQRQARELISVPNLVTEARLLSFNMTQSRFVIGLLAGHNTLRRHVYIMGLQSNPICRRCGTEEETSIHIMCECEALTSISTHAWVPSFWIRRISGY